MSLSRLASYIKRNQELLIVVIVAVAFFVFTSSFNFLSQKRDFVKWLSPDETANYTIAKVFAETGSLQFFEKYNLLAKDIIHPRSFRSDWGWIKPVSFLGLPIIYGWLGHLFGTMTLPYLTPFFGAVGLIFFYLLIKEIFDKRVGLLATVLLGVFPVYTYYSARSFFHNVLFMVFLIAGLYFGVIMNKKNTEESSYLRRKIFPHIYALVAGVALGGAIISRTSELIWVAPLLGGLYLFNCHRINVFKLFLLLLGLSIAVSPVAYWNYVLYGSWYASGYPELNNSLGTLTTTGGTLAETTLHGNFLALKPILAKIKMTIFHFGFKPQQSLKMFNNYVITMFPWLFWSAVAGFILFLVYIKRYTRGRWLFILAWGCVSAILVLYYGSWIFYDNPDPRSFTIGNSYTRYWLPLYAGALVLTSLAVVTLTKYLRKPRLIAIVHVTVVAVLATISLRFVWLDPSEGLQVSIEKQAAAQEEWREVLDLTETRAVIITRYHDKLLFPERKVIIGLFDDKNMMSEYAHLTAYLPVYYYNFTLPEKDITYLNNGPLAERSVRLEVVRQITDKFTLYRLIPQSSLPPEENKPLKNLHMT